MSSDNFFKTNKIIISQINDVYKYLNELLPSLYKLKPHQITKVIDDIKPFLNSLKEDLYVLIETEYVDKIYRDSYYNYYSSKLEHYYRNCIRFSFFQGAITEDLFRNEDYYNSRLKNDYLGFLVIRPTFPKVIGRNALSPRAKKENNIVCCLTTINVTAHALKFDILSFPHASQDGETISCAETTIWSLFEYFGNKYPEYKPILPSAITRVLQKFSYKRLLPTKGLTAEQITYTVRELGFGSLIYSKSRHNDFEAILSTYIESGIPIIGVVTNDHVSHAFNIIGREEDNLEEFNRLNITDTLKNGARIIDYHKVERKYVVIDDNRPPFQTISLEAPGEHYPDPKWHDSEFVYIIVPLYSKIYLEAEVAKKSFINLLESNAFGLEDDNPRVLRTFLASSRSYKSFIALNYSENYVVRELIISFPMPKFIWIAEISLMESFTNGECNGIIIQDATEPLTHISESSSMSVSIILGYINNLLFIQQSGNFASTDLTKDPTKDSTDIPSTSTFKTYNQNLKK